MIKISAFIWKLLVCSLPYQQVPKVCGLEVLQGFIEGDDWGRVQVLCETWRKWCIWEKKKVICFNIPSYGGKQICEMFRCETAEMSDLVGRSPEPPTPVWPFPTLHFLLCRLKKKKQRMKRSKSVQIYPTRTQMSHKAQRNDYLFSQWNTAWRPTPIRFDLSYIPLQPHRPAASLPLKLCVICNPEGDFTCNSHLVSKIQLPNSWGKGRGGGCVRQKE